MVTRARLRAELVSKLPFNSEITICDGREIVRLMSRHPFGNRPVRPNIVSFVSVLSRRPRLAPATPMSFPPRGRRRVRVVARDTRYVFGMYRRQLKVIGYFGKLDRIFGVPVTTRNWNTMSAIVKVLGSEGT